jgi:hypothetical protein
MPPCGVRLRACRRPGFDCHEHGQGRAAAGRACDFPPGVGRPGRLFGHLGLPGVSGAVPPRILPLPSRWSSLRGPVCPPLPSAFRRAGPNWPHTLMRVAGLRYCPPSTWKPPNSTGGGPGAWQKDAPCRGSAGPSSPPPVPRAAPSNSGRRCPSRLASVRHSGCLTEGRPSCRCPQPGAPSGRPPVCAGCHGN